MEGFVIPQTQEVLILLGRDKVLRLYHLSSEYPNKKRGNQGRV